MTIDALIDSNVLIAILVEAHEVSLAALLEPYKAKTPRAITAGGVIVGAGTGFGHSYTWSAVA